MHPEIETYWMEQGLTLYHTKDDFGGILYFVVPNAVVQKGYTTFKQVVTKHSDGHFEYLWNNQWINEETMLRIVRMKAFL